MLKTKWTVVLLFWLLAGCSTVKPVVKTEIVEVKVPVRVACTVSVPDRPSSVVLALPANADIFDKVKALLVDRKNDDAHIVELSAALSACKQ